MDIQSNNDTPQKRAGREVGMALLRGAVGWTEGEDHPEVYSEMLVHIDNRRIWREVVADRLRRAPHLLPARMTKDLADQLTLLNDGTGNAPSLLAPLTKAGQGVDPSGARRSELALLCWIEHEKARKVHVKITREKVARAVGLTVSNSLKVPAIEKWLEFAKKEFGAEAWKGWIAAVRKNAKAGLPFNQDEAWTLEAEAARWKAAKSVAPPTKPAAKKPVAKRTAPKT
jgi:hypothetical protein